MNKIEKATLALGNFDGVHTGHRRIIEKAIDVGGKENVYVCSFEPHPLQVLVPNPPKIITPKEEKLRIIEEIIGVKYFAMEFNMKLAKLTGEEFVQMLLDTFQIENVVVGANYYFGDHARYSAKDLKELGKKYGFSVYIVHELKEHGKVVSSTRIRQYLSEGNVRHANKLLGREFSIQGICQKGRGIGESIGFATANLATVDEYQYPAQGVYATKTILEDKEYISMTNVGYNPTVTEERTRMIETHLLDFNEVLYGKNIRVEFVQLMRPEEKYETLQELKDQLELDKQLVKKIFNKT